MAHKILNQTTIVTVNTEVEYTFPDGSIEVVDVSHFEPKSQEEILKNIENRYESELLKKTLGEE